MGDTKGGAFDIPGELARHWLQLPLNPNGRPNSDVLRPWMNGMDVTRQPSGRWIIDFGWQMTEREAALYEAPLAYARSRVLPDRQKLRREAYRIHWWRHVEARPGMWRALRGLHRFIVTPRVARHRMFIWFDSRILPDSRLFAFVKDDDTFFGLLQSRLHEIWSLKTCSWHGVGNDPTDNRESVFETSPFPKGLTPNIPAAEYAGDPRAVAIAAAARRLDELRNNWLNPPDLVRRVPEVVAGYPDRILPVDAKAAAILRKRTLTNFYNERPAWLDHAHRELDRAVAAAYGWPADLSEEDVLAKLWRSTASARHRSRPGSSGQIPQPPPAEFSVDRNTYRFRRTGRFRSILRSSIVITGLVPVIHGSRWGLGKTWMPVTSTGMTSRGCRTATILHPFSANGPWIIARDRCVRRLPGPTMVAAVDLRRAIGLDRPILRVSPACERRAAARRL